MMNLKVHLKNVVSWAIMFVPAVVSAQDSRFDRVISLAYINVGGPQIDYNDTYFFQQIDRIQPPVTALVPFLLNVGHPDHYESTLQGLANRSIVIVPGIGDNGTTPIDSPQYQTIATQYRKYTDSIELENTQAYVELDDGLDHLNAMIEYLNGTLGFQHIQLNPWPHQQGSQDLIPFANPAVDSTILQVLLNFSRETYEITKDKTNWYPNQPKILKVLQLKPNASVLINYENMPQEAALAMIPERQQIKAFQTTIHQINKYNAHMDHGRVHWSPPFSQNYNPIDEGTWPFIIQELSSM